MSSSQASYSGQIFSKLRKNKAALLGLLMIIISFVIAIFAYFISPDPSPFANRIILEIGGKRPGYTQSFLKLKKEKKVGATGIGQQLLNGREDPWLYIPVEAFEIKGDSMIVNKLIDEGLTERQSYLLSSLAASPVTTKQFLLGTDKYGRDLLSRLIVGTRVSLSVGLVTLLISLSIGLVLGAVAGYFRGRTDNIIMWFINIIWSIPTLLLVFAITLVLGKGFWQIFIAVGLTMWVNVARLVRGQVLAIREMEYIEAGKALGYSHFRIISKHIIPNILGPVMVIAASNFAAAIVIEAGLSFLGVGVQPPQPSWGLMIKENYNFIITQNPMPALAPGIAIMMLVLAFNMLGNGLRDAFDVRA
ncbi:MAG: ABC transporter permease subunit [Terrimonas sp.]|nr:ABC transporter permease subunit [Terrimonas sp.]